MKRHQYSKAAKRPGIIIEASVGGSVSFTTTDNKLHDQDKNFPLASAPRYHRKVPKNVSIAPVADEDFGREINSISNIEFDPAHQHPSEMTSEEKPQENIIEVNNLSNDPQHQLTHPSNSVGNGAQTDQIHDHANLNATGLTELSPIQNTTLNSGYIQMNNPNNVKTYNVRLMSQCDSVNNGRRKYILKFNRKYFATHCCSYSPLCVIAYVFTGLLVAGAIAAPITVVMIKNRATTMTTTMITTTTTTTTTTITATTTTSTTTTTTSTTTTTIANTTTTATTTALILSIVSSDTVRGLWNAIAGGNAVLAMPGQGAGNFIQTERPQNAVDGNFTNKYLSFGSCDQPNTLNSSDCGLNTGFYVTVRQGASVIKGLRFFTANDFPSRDPITMTMEGSNQTAALLMFGSSWKLIYNGSCGLDVDPGRHAPGEKQSFSYNNIAYQSYRLLITSKRSNANSVQYAEVELFES